MILKTINMLSSKPQRCGKCCWTLHGHSGQDVGYHLNCLEKNYLSLCSLAVALFDFFICIVISHLQTPKPDANGKHMAKRGEFHTSAVEELPQINSSWQVHLRHSALFGSNIPMVRPASSIGLNISCFSEKFVYWPIDGGCGKRLIFGIWDKKKSGSYFIRIRFFLNKK